MADVELVIKIPEEVKDIQVVCEALNDGTPLPKGHGRIGDLDALRCENTDFDTYNDYCIMFDEIEAAETIIGADKLENEEA
jgi:hypothetical protein